MMRPGRLLAPALGLIAAVLAACDLAPPETTPLMEIPTTYKEGDAWALADPRDAAPSEAWWRVFGDAHLDSLEAQIESANQDLRAAVARFDEARAQAAIARADLFPTVGASGAATSTGLSGAVANPLPARRYGNYGLGLDLQYELDVWGRVRNAAKAGRERAQAAAGDVAAVDLRLQAELATDYFVLRADDAQQAILDRTVASYAKAFELNKARFETGYGAETEVAASEAQYRLAQTQAADIGLQRSQLEHAIAILIGKPPATFSLPANPLTGAPPQVAAELPGRLLERRPDVAAAERRVAAANAEIGVARVAYYPSFSLGGFVDTQAAQPSRLFTAPATAWSVGPSAAFALFDVGRRRALNAQAKAAYQELVANYRQSVLDAYAQVEDSLAAIRQLGREADSQEAGVAAARQSNAQASRLFAGGLASYDDVVTTENIELAAELTEARIRGQRMVAAASLIEALGGGWTREGLRSDSNWTPSAEKPGSR